MELPSIKDTKVKDNKFVMTDDAEIAAMKKRIKEMEEETAKLKELQDLLAEKESKVEMYDQEADMRSVFIGNVKIWKIFNSRLIMRQHVKNYRLIFKVVEQ